MKVRSERTLEIRIRFETEIEDDGRWLADVPDLPGVLAYGATREEAVRAAGSLALRVIAERIEQGDAIGGEGGEGR